MPRMSDTMEEGVIVAWHKQVGDKVAIGELLAEIETDKATMDFESPVAGVLLHIGVEKGQAVKIDSLLAIIGEKGEDVSALLKNEPAKAPEKKAAPVAAAEFVSASAPVTAEVTSRQTTVAGNGNVKIKASPLAKRLAKESGVSLAHVKGTGDEGRIVKRDVEALIKTKPAGVPVAPTISARESFEEIPHTQMRKTIAKRLFASKFTAPHYYLTMEISMDNAIEARKGINEELAPVKISFNDLIVKAAAMALKKHPYVNAYWGEESIRLNHHVHIGIAVAVEHGLIVPVLRFANEKSLAQISQETQQLAERGRAGQLKLDELQGNTFTVSNLGMFDIDEFTAIINPPSSCILAVGKIKETAAIKNGLVFSSSVMKVTMSCDHRVVDGATGAKFLQTFKQYLENPVRMMV